LAASKSERMPVLLIKLTSAVLTINMDGLTPPPVNTSANILCAEAADSTSNLPDNDTITASPICWLTHCIKVHQTNPHPPVNPST
jgi:hypothetical protein